MDDFSIFGLTSIHYLNIYPLKTRKLY